MVNFFFLDNLQKMLFLLQLLLYKCGKLCVDILTTYVIVYSNLARVKNIIKIYASGIYFCSPRRIECNGANGLKNEDRMMEINHFFPKKYMGPTSFGQHTTAALPTATGRALPPSATRRVLSSSNVM